jgi:hypothetical protein
VFIAQPLRQFFLATVLFLATALWAAVCFGQPFGKWKLNFERSTFAGDIRPKTLSLRIEPRATGETVTLDRIEINGQMSSSSMVLYLDGVARDFQQGECSGTQSSRRIDGQTVEVLRDCGAGAWTRLVRRIAPQNQLVWEISEQRADGRRFDRRLVFEKR